MSQRISYDARLPKSVLVLAALACALSLSKVGAAAAPKDAQALKLDDDAINNDYLATKFGDAEKKLKQAIGLCSKAGSCSPNVVAQLHRDLGIVYVVASRADEAKAQFAEALKADPSTTLPKDLTTPEIEQVFSIAKGGGAPAPAPSPAPAPAPSPAPTKPPPAPSGGEEIVHTPPAESATMTPLPLYAELPEAMSPTKVQIKYKPFGAPDWKSIDMKKMKTGYGVELPCIEIGNVPGDLKYYIQALGSGGEVIATNGTKNAPLKVAVKEALTGEAPHLPGKPAPKVCSGTGAADCPPEFPGCKQSKKGTGFSCENDGECQSGQCVSGSCFSDEAPENKCESDTGCETGQWCNAGVCASPRKNWIGVAIQQDVLFVPPAKDVCVDQGEYSCFESGLDAAYNGHPVAGASDEVAGGFTQSTTRIMLTYDRVVHEAVTVGARLGYAFGAGPVAEGGTPFFPAHIEARAAYWFGSDPFIRVGVRPYVAGLVGVGQFDGKVPIKVYNGPTAMPNTPAIDIDAWRKAGTIFAGVGVGMMYALDHNSGINFELRGAGVFPKSGGAASLHVGYSMGLF